MWEFQPLTSLPMFSSPNFGWTTNSNYEACTITLSTVPDQYGSSWLLSSGCGERVVTKTSTTQQATETAGPAGSTVAVDTATGTLTTTQFVTGLAVIGAAVAIGLSSGGSGGSSGTTGTTGTR